MAAAAQCRHDIVEFIGVQETVEGLPELHLFNCKHCQTTVARWGGSVSSRSNAGLPIPKN
jgi:hypothetical protein